MYLFVVYWCFHTNLSSSFAKTISNNQVMTFPGIWKYFLKIFFENFTQLSHSFPSSTPPGLPLPQDSAFFIFNVHASVYILCLTEPAMAKRIMLCACAEDLEQHSATFLKYWQEISVFPLSRVFCHSTA